MSLKSIVNALDNVSSNLHLKMKGPSPALSTFLFHACMENDADYDHQLLYPQERLTVTQFQYFIEYLLDAGFEIIRPDRLDDLESDKHYAIITFDDGYYNNFNLLPVLETFQVPALFFIPTAYLTNGKIFWSDALYHHRKKTNETDEKILAEIMKLKAQQLTTIENYIVQNFGVTALDATHDFNRFMTQDEFLKFTQHPLVYIGNHTHNHEILTNLSENEVQYEFETSQKILQQLLGHKPHWVSYPNGSFNNTIIDIAFKNDMHIGISTIMEKNYFPLQSHQEKQLLFHRFNPLVIDGTMDLNKFRSDFQLKTALKKWLR